MPSMTFKQIMQLSVKFSYVEVEDIIISELKGYFGRPDVLSIGSNNPVTKMYALCGPHGMGKTYFWKRLAQQHKVPIRRIVFGEKEVEDALGIPSEKGDEVGHHTMLAPPGFPIEVPEDDITGKFDLMPERELKGSEFKGKGILLINEFCTANAKQESQLRSLVSDRMIGDHRLGDGWMVVGDTNPLDHRYHTVNQLDESVQSRIILLPVQCNYEDAMAFWQNTKQLGSAIYTFLRVNKEFWKEIDNRRWVAVGDTVECFLTAGAKENVIGKVLAVMTNEAISTAFLKFRHYGDDPFHYPILANDYISGDKTKHEDHITLIKRWKKDTTKQILLQVSAIDMKDWISQPGRTYENKADKETAISRISEMMLEVGTAQAVEMLEHCDRPLGLSLYEKLKGTPLEKKMQELSLADFKDRFSK